MAPPTWADTCALKAVQGYMFTRDNLDGSTT